MQFQKPDFGETKWRSFCEKFVNFCEKDLFKFFFRHVFFVGFPAFGWWLFTSGDDIPLENKLGAFGKFLETSSLLVLLSAWAWVTICKVIYSVIKHYAKPKKRLSRDDVLAILEQIYTVVSIKANRMRDFAGKERIGSAGEIFLGITQPREQIRKLTTAMHELFVYLDGENAQWKTRLCRIADGSPAEWVAYEPAGTAPRTNLEDLADPASAFSQCIRRRSLHIVENIEQGARRSNGSAPTCIRGVGADVQGSLLCVPLMHPDNEEVLFVLCVSCNVPHVLNESDREYYQWLLDHFFARFVIESSLYILRERVDDGS